MTIETRDAIKQVELSREVLEIELIKARSNLSKTVMTCDMEEFGTAVEGPIKMIQGILGAISLVQQTEKFLKKQARIEDKTDIRGGISPDEWAED